MIADMIAGLFSAGPGPSDDFWYGPVAPFSWMQDIEMQPDQAMRIGCVMACVRVLSETLASMPLHLMEYSAQTATKSRAIGAPLYRLLHDQPNGWQTAFEFIEQLVTDMCLRGNGYVFRVPGASGAVDQLIRLHPDKMKVFVVKGNVPGSFRFVYRYKFGETDEPVNLSQDEIMHLRIMGDGLVGQSVLSAHRTFELTGQAERHGERYFKNHAKPGGVLTLPEEVYLEDEEQKQSIQADWRKSYTGDSLYNIAILEAGMKFSPVSVSNADSQFMELRQYQRSEIAGVFRVPPHMIGDLEHATYSNIEEQNMAFVVHTMLPWARRFEQAITRDLVVDQGRYYPKFSFESLLRGNAEKRAQFYTAMRRLGVYSGNDIAQLEDMNPFDGGDVRFIEHNLVPLTQQATAPPTQTAATISEHDRRAERKALAKLLKMSRTIDQRTADMDLQQAAHEACATGRHAEQLNALSQHATDMANRVDAMATDSQDSHEAHAAAVGGLVETANASLRFAQQTATLKQNDAETRWIADIAERIAAAELRELGKRADKAAEDSERFLSWAHGFWGGKHRDYVDKSLSPVCRNAPRVAERVCNAALTQIVEDNDPVQTLASWQKHRAEQISLCIEEHIQWITMQK